MAPRKWGYVYLRIDMCKDCGKCSKEHSRTIDDAVDEILDLPI